MRKSIIWLLFFVFLTFFVNALPGDWNGEVSVEGTPISAGAVIEVTKSDGTVLTSTTTPTTTTGQTKYGDDYYVVAFETTNDANITFLVCGVNSYSTIFTSGTHALDINVFLQSNGAVCSCNDVCSSGICSNNICVSDTSPGGSSSGGGSSGGGGGGGGGGSSITPSTTNVAVNTTEEVDINSGNSGGSNQAPVIKSVDKLGEGSTSFNTNVEGNKLNANLDSPFSVTDAEGNLITGAAVANSSTTMGLKNSIWLWILIAILAGGYAYWWFAKNNFIGLSRQSSCNYFHNRM